MIIRKLTVEHLENAFGIDSPNPRFSWIMESEQNGVRQVGYQILVKQEKENGNATTVWDSGWKESARSQNLHYEGSPLESRGIYSVCVHVEAVSEDGISEEADSEVVHFEMGLCSPDDWEAKWVRCEDSVDPDARKPALYLRKEFFVRPGLRKARAYQTAHGLYDFFLNGTAGTSDKFMPGLTSYYARIQYQCHDITKLLHEGKNCWSVRLADGWWRGVTGGTIKNNFGYTLAFFGQLELCYEDGSREVIASDTSFRWNTGGLLASDMQMGDIYDARKEPDGWMLPGFSAAGWQLVMETDDPHHAALIASQSVPVREMEHFPANEFTDSKGRRVLDFGQNIAGYVRMKLRNTKSGQSIRLLHGEDIKDGAFSQDNISNTGLELSAFQEVHYLCKGAELEEYCPSFAIFGFRYVLLEGYEEALQPGDFTAIAVYSAMPETGSFTCSHPKINQLVHNALWSQKGNYMDVAVDCPTRERNSWTGDAQIYTKTATWFMDVYSFYEKWLKDQTLEQFASGKVGITFPSTSSHHNEAEFKRVCGNNPFIALAGPGGDGNVGEDCAGWGDASAYIPTMIYLSYGDPQIIKNQYPTARKWVDHMLDCAKDHNPLYEDLPQYHHVGDDGNLDADFIYDTRMHYGEWVEPIAKEPTGESLAEAFVRMMKEGKPLVATAYMARSCENVSDMANVLGRKDEAEHYALLAARIREVYDRYFIADDGVIEPGHQAAYVRALQFDLCGPEKRPKVLEQLILEIQKNDYRLNTGFLSTPFLLPVLVDNGYTNVAYRILEQTRNPSWLHAVELGATTILENWDGMDEHKSSFNHYSFGAVCDFLFSYTAGIRARFEKPGFQEFDLIPVPGGSLSHAEAEFKSPYGTIRSAWKKMPDKTLQYTCTIPVNTTAYLNLPNGCQKTLGSGTYHFEVKQDA